MALIDAASGNHPSLWPWLNQVPPIDVHASVISVGRVRHTIHVMAVGTNRATYHQNLTLVVAQIRRFGNLHPVNHNVTTEWWQLLRMGQLLNNTPNGPAPLPDEERLVIATALSANLILVDNSHPFHANLPLGVHIY
jgi:hypothetical protein